MSCNNRQAAFLIMTKTLFLTMWCALVLGAGSVLLTGCGEKDREKEEVPEGSRGGTPPPETQPPNDVEPSVPDPAELPNVPDPAELPNVPDPAEIDQ